MGTEVAGVIVLKPKLTREGDPKRYDIIRVEASGDVDKALRGLPEQEHVIVDLGALEVYRPEYITIQKNHKVS